VNVSDNECINHDLFLKGATEFVEQLSKDPHLLLLEEEDARYCLTMVDIGACDRESNGGVFGNSKFNHLVQENRLNIPDCCALPGGNDTAPYIFVADNAFPLRINMLKLFAGKNLPYKESVQSSGAVCMTRS